MERWQPAAAALGALVCAGAAAGVPALARWALGHALPPAESRAWRWPLGAVAGAAAAGALVLGRVGWSAAAPAYAVFVVLGVALSYADLATHRLPTRLTVPAALAGLALLAIPALEGSTGGMGADGMGAGRAVADVNAGGAVAAGAGAAYVRAVAGGLALFAAYLCLHLINPGGIGRGDVRYAAAVGIHLGWLGWTAVLTGTFAAAVAGAVAGLAVAARQPNGLRAHVAFGPAMFAGAVLAIALGPDAGAGWLVWAAA